MPRRIGAMATFDSYQLTDDQWARVDIADFAGPRAFQNNAAQPWCSFGLVTG
ncbi:hypothetical protein [Corynebacterium glyciniphilum]|uniref:hypothetical protein n=1 Tax=Corynebacterium glyciniphilum TaxID=1404244 RepID=UPI003D9FFE5A